MSGKVSRGLLAASVLLSVTATSAVHAVSDDVALQLLERLGELEKEVSNLRGENEMLQNELQGIKSAQQQNVPAPVNQVNEPRIQESVPTDPVTVPQVMATDALSLPALEDPLAPAPTPVVPAPVTIDLSAGTQSSYSDPEDRKAVAPAVEFNPDSAAKEAVDVDPQSPESYYYYGTEDRNQPDVSATAATGNQPAANPDPATTVTVQPAISTLPDSHQAKAEYNQAYKALVNDPGSAIPAFKAFLEKYPTHELAANAQYWLGEALYAQKNYSGATEEFMVVLKEHKKSSKAPGAALKLGYSFYELGQWDFARRTLEDTVRFFPDSNAAILAKQRLEKMSAEGH